MCDDWGCWIDVITIAFSVIALYVARKNYVEIQRLNRLSHKAVLAANEVKGFDEYRYEIINKGNDTAYFESVEWFWLNRPIDADRVVSVIHDYVHENGLPPTQTVAELGNNSVMSAGEKITIVSIKIKVEHIPIIQKLEMEGGLGLRIKYRYGFGEVDVFTSDNVVAG